MDLNRGPSRTALNFYDPLRAKSGLQGDYSCEREGKGDFPFSPEKWGRVISP